MEQKIAALTEKIYKEGVAKGEEERKAIIESAQKEAARLKDDARRDAEKITADAAMRAKEMVRNAESEMKLSSQQAINALKQKINDELLAKIIDAPVGKALSDTELIKNILLETVKGWQSKPQETPSLEILLPESSKAALEKAVAEAVKKALKEGVSITGNKAMKAGFQIGPKDGTYKISFTDEDFIEFFKEYLRPKTRALLFKE